MNEAQRPAMLGAVNRPCDEDQLRWMAADDANVLKRAAEIRADPERLKRARDTVRLQRDELAVLLDIIG